ncbi:hypothetical protein [Enterobacter chengduensis]|uniref:hypothetical protein n=1 Tax=Enterobacter chengduensis TaxID=2494701 RepID=UPI003D7014C3
MTLRIGINRRVFFNPPAIISRVAHAYFPERHALGLLLVMMSGRKQPEAACAAE